MLKKAGVVDAGGKGLCYIFEGMLSVFRDGTVISSQQEELSGDLTSDDFFRNAAAEFDQEINFTYCTEFIVGRDPSCRKEPAELRAYLESIGDCVVVVDDDEIIKVHVHTEEPGNALQAALAYGQLLTVKIENMKEQHRKAQEANEEAKAKAAAEEKKPLEPVEPTEEIGFVAVAAGEGLHTLFTDLGCAQVVSGGQTMNPSTDDILAAVRATPAKTVLVLPNNKNIIMAAEQTVPLVTDRKVIVLPTRTVPQGLSALLAYDPDSAIEQNTVSMMEAAGRVDTGSVTFAARDSEYGGLKIHEGDILGLKNGKLMFVEKDIVHTCSKLTRSMVTRGTSFITLLYGSDVTEEQANDAYNRIKAKVAERHRNHARQRRAAGVLFPHLRGITQSHFFTFPSVPGPLSAAQRPCFMGSGRMDNKNRGIGRLRPIPPFRKGGGDVASLFEMPVTALRGVGEKRAALFRKIGAPHGGRPAPVLPAHL